MSYLFYIDTKKHWFKQFKVYWAYRWWIAEQMDINGVHDPADRTQTKLISVGYRHRYSK